MRTNCAALIAAASAAFFVAACQTVEPPPPVAAIPMNCGNVGKAQFSEIRERAFKVFPDIKIVVLRDEKRDIFLQAFNASPPASDYTADTIHIFNSATANRRYPNQPDTSFMVMVDANGCVLSSGEMETIYIIRWSRGEVTKPQRASSDPRFPPAPTRQALF